MTFINLNFKKKKFVTLNREVHKWTGVLLSAFVLVITITGFVLIHEKNWKWLKTVEVPGVLIPGWAAEEMAKKAGHVKALTVAQTGEGKEPRLMVGTQTGLFTHNTGAWASAGPEGGQVEVTALLLTEQRWLLGTHRGLFQSQDQGLTWTAVEDTSGMLRRAKINVIQQSPFDPRTIYLGAKAGGYRSVNGGEHWESLAERFPMTAAVDDGIEVKEKAKEVSAVAYDSERPGTVFLGTHHGVYRFDEQTGSVSALDMTQVAALSAEAKPRMTLGKYLNDLHTGKLFADKLWTLYDLTALSLVLFVGTGLYIWIYPKSVKWRKEREQARMEANRIAGPTYDAGPHRTAEGMIASPVKEQRLLQQSHL